MATAGRRRGPDPFGFRGWGPPRPRPGSVGCGRDDGGLCRERPDQTLVFGLEEPSVEGEDEAVTGRYVGLRLARAGARARPALAMTSPSSAFSSTLTE